VSVELGVALPFWLDRPDKEAVEIACAAEQAGINTVWIGEMATFDAFALATALGLQTERARLKVGPLAIGVRSPVSIALGISSVATLTDRPVDVALGASSPAIVGGWHDRPWEAPAPRMAETVPAVRSILAGDRAELDGRHVRTHGFHLRRALPGASICVAAFGPAMTRVAARQADEVVLNLVTAAHVARVRARIDAEARAAAITPPRLAVWLPVALNPGTRARAQLSAQLAIYLRAPGYGEMFAQLGFGSLVERARQGTPRSELAAAIPPELIAGVSAVGSRAEIVDRIAAYHDAGADHVGVVPSTAEDPAGAAVLAALGPARSTSTGCRPTAG
jgi:probable F420-dependent oxidoreductase